LDEHFPVVVSGRGCDRDQVAAEARQEALPATEMGKNKRGKTGLKPGEEYRIWNARDVLGTLPGEYCLVLERAAGWVGVSCEYLGAVVEKYEKRIVRWDSRKQ
jgi:RNA polymerase I-specific transcription initiation factor RRN7